MSEKIKRSLVSLGGENIQVNDYTKERLKYFKKMYEKEHGKTTWQYFIYLII